YGSTYYGLSEIRFVGSIASCWPESFPLQVESITVDEDLNAMMDAQQQGWLGSDVAKSVRLDEHRVLWLFGDTFIGNVENGRRQPGARFINNSIGIQDLDAPTGSQMTYYWGPEDTSF